MITLTIEEHQIIKDDDIIPDLVVFLKSLPKSEDMVLIIKSHDASYHDCPVRRAVPFVKSAEYSPNHWIGESVFPVGGFIKSFYHRKTLIGGILPTPFMRNAIRIIVEQAVALRGIFIWSDLLLRSYGSLPMGWVIIWHDHEILICQNNRLLFSRSCYQPLSQELPSILRYLKRFGYEPGMPITLIAASKFQEELPEFIVEEIRTPQKLEPKGLKIEIPECIPLLRLYFWPIKMRAISYSLALCNVIGMAYLGWQIAFCYNQMPILTNQISGMTPKPSTSEIKMEAFSQYCQLAKERDNPLILLRRFIPYLKDKAVATFVHWTPYSLTLHLELNDVTEVDPLWSILRAQFHDYKLIWQPQKNEPSKGILTITKNQMTTSNLQPS